MWPDGHSKSPDRQRHYRQIRPSGRMMLAKHNCLQESPILLGETIQGKIHPPSSSHGHPAASVGATRTAGPTMDGWLCPDANMKEQESRLNAASSTLAAAFDPTPLRRSRSKAVKGIKKSSIPRSADFDKQSAKNSAKVSAIALSN